VIFNVVDRRADRYAVWVEGVLEPSCHDNSVSKLNIPDDNTWTIKTYENITIPTLFEIAYNINTLVTVFIYDSSLKESDVTEDADESE